MWQRYLLPRVHTYWRTKEIIENFNDWNYLSSPSLSLALSLFAYLIGIFHFKISFSSSFSITTLLGFLISLNICRRYYLQSFKVLWLKNKNWKLKVTSLSYIYANFNKKQMSNSIFFFTFNIILNKGLFWLYLKYLKHPIYMYVNHRYTRNIHPKWIRAKKLKKLEIKVDQVQGHQSFHLASFPLEFNLSWVRKM